MTATAIKERPILFSAEMVRAILDGRKTQTRRVVKPQPVQHSNGHWEFGSVMFWDYSNLAGEYCPYGKPGDRLWVRETWMPLWETGDGNLTCLPATEKPDVIKYLADGEKPDGFDAKWRPSIHMPRRASRITLEITDVRVERLQEISENDARAEGVPFSLMASTHRLGFENLWGSINGPDSWAANPWVWAITFKRLEQPQ